MARFRSSSTGGHTAEEHTSHSAGAPTTIEGTLDRRYLVKDNRVDARQGHERWSTEQAQEHTRIVLSPIAAPSILGLFGFFFATLLVGTHLAGWWGNVTSPILIFPVAIFLGGIAQLLAGMWAYKARDGAATAIHGIWGGFWLAYGLYQLFVAVRVLPPVVPPKDVAFGFWFIPIAAITLMVALATLATSLGLFAVAGPLGAGSAFAAAGFIGGIAWCLTVAGWLFVVAAAAAWYTASAMMTREAFGRTILPTLEWRKAANIPGRQPAEPIEYEGGMPGSKVGQ